MIICVHDSVHVIMNANDHKRLYSCTHTIMHECNDA